MKPQGRDGILLYRTDLLCLVWCSARSRLSAPPPPRALTSPPPPSLLSCGASLAQRLLNVPRHETSWKRLALLGTTLELGEGA